VRRSAPPGVGDNAASSDAAAKAAAQISRRRRRLECLPSYRRRPRRTTSPAIVCAGGGSADVPSILENDGAGVDPPRWSQHPLPWQNTPSGGENHLTDANGRPVYDGSDAAEMFRLYAGAAQAAARFETDRTRLRDSGTGQVRHVGLVAQLRRLLRRWR
jgi:hypothetical protein